MSILIRSSSVFLPRVGLLFAPGQGTPYFTGDVLTEVEIPTKYGSVLGVEDSPEVG